MKTRETGYDDYGFEKKEDKRLKAYCQSVEFDDQILLFHACLEANKQLAGTLYYSLVNNLSYEDIDQRKYVPISKGDFYGWQRKALNIFRNLLILSRKWV